MQIQIKVKTVGVESPVGKKYQVAEVIYGDERGETKTKKLMSFSNPGVFATLSNAKAGATYTIDQTKNDKGYWDWQTATEGAATPATSAQATSSPARSTYETAEERAVKQKLIVKQSCLAQAIQFDKTNLDNTLEIADQLVAWVYDAPELVTEDA